VISGARLGPGTALLLVAMACSAQTGEDSRTASDPAETPRAVSTATDHPVLQFNLTEEDALDYLKHLDERAEAALHDGELGSLKDVYISHGPAGRRAAALVIEDFRNGWVNRTRIEARSTEILRIRSDLAVFRQIRLVYPCIYEFDTNLDVTPDSRVLRQVVVRYMALENLNWRLERDVVKSSRPTGDRVKACPL
jgi:hypothetical protein